jgi:hypothetical protein
MPRKKDLKSGKLAKENSRPATFHFAGDTPWQRVHPYAFMVIFCRHRGKTPLSHT